MSIFEQEYIPVLKIYADAPIDIENDLNENAILLDLVQMGLIHMKMHVYKNKKIAIKASITEAGKRILKLFEEE
jgi:hypothetical protein